MLLEISLQFTWKEGTTDPGIGITNKQNMTKIIFGGQMERLKIL